MSTFSGETTTKNGFDRDFSALVIGHRNILTIDWKAMVCILLLSNLSCQRTPGKEPLPAGNSTSENNILLVIDCAGFFFTKEGKGGENYRLQVYSAVASAGKKEGF